MKQIRTKEKRESYSYTVDENMTLKRKNLEKSQRNKKASKTQFMDCSWEEIKNPVKYSLVLRGEPQKLDSVKKNLVLDLFRLFPYYLRRDALSGDLLQAYYKPYFLSYNPTTQLIIGNTIKTSDLVEACPPGRKGPGATDQQVPDLQGNNFQISGKNLKEIWNIKEKKSPGIVISSKLRKNFREISKDIKMAIDLPETIPSIINSFKRSNSAKTLQKLTKNLKSYDKSSKFSFLWPKSCKNEQCRCSFPNCKDCQNKLNGASECSGNECRVKSAYITCQNFDSNVESETEADCEQTLLNGAEVKSDLNFENVYNWNLRENEMDSFPNKFWKGKKSVKSKFFARERQDDEALLNSPSEVRKRKKRGKGES